MGMQCTNDTVQKLPRIQDCNFFLLLSSVLVTIKFHYALLMHSSWKQSYTCIIMAVFGHGVLEIIIMIRYNEYLPVLLQYKDNSNVVRVAYYVLYVRKLLLL